MLMMPLSPNSLWLRLRNWTLWHVLRAATASVDQSDPSLFQERSMEDRLFALLVKIEDLRV
jgi:hypothetical protein